MHLGYSTTLNGIIWPPKGRHSPWCMPYTNFIIIYLETNLYFMWTTWLYCT
jgi:hypothetical protein